MKSMKNLVLSFVILTGLVQLACAQKPSPAKTASGKAGATEISIAYSAPSVKGREIWGKLVPYDAVWRTGANEATTIKFSKDVTVEGQKLAAGEYSLFTIPTVGGEWTIIFNKTAKQWGAYEYKQSEDALRVNVKSAANAMTEQLDLAIKSNADNSATISIAWEKLKVAFKVK